MGKYEEVEMKIIGEPTSIYGLRLSHGDTEEEINIHFKYIDNTQQDIIQNCVFVLRHRENECELIRTICNTFLPITPRPLLQRNDIRVCNDGSDVQLVEKEANEEENAEETTTIAVEQVEAMKAEAEVEVDAETRQKQQTAEGRNEDAEVISK